MKTATGDAQGQQTQGEDGTAGAATQGQPAAKEPKTVLIKHDGKQISIREEELIPLAQQGFDYSNKIRTLNARKERVDELDRLHERAKTEPRFARAFELAMTDPDGVVTRYSTQPAHSQSASDNDGDGGDDQQTGKVKSAKASELEELREENRRLAARLDRNDAKLQGRDDREEIVTEIARYPWLKGKAAAEARERVLERRERNPRGDSIETLVGAEAHRIKELLADAEQRKLEQSDQDKRTQTLSMRRGMPERTEKPKYDANSIKDGTVRKNLRAAARLMGLS